MTEIFEIADRSVANYARLDPTLASIVGLPADEAAMTDYSPDGFAARANLQRLALESLGKARVEGEADRIARDVMRERLQVSVDGFNAGEHFLALNGFTGPFGSIRLVFDQMPRQTERDWRDIARRLSKAPASLGSFEQTVERALERGVHPAPRQLEDLARQGEVWSGQAPGSRPVFGALVAAYDASGIENAALRTELEAAAGAATDAYAASARRLRAAAARSTARDACGPERYALLSRSANGATLNLIETYEWGWDELHRIEAEMAATADRILPGASIDAVVDFLETDAERGFDNSETYRRWLQQIHDETLVALRGTHFDIDQRIMSVECVIPPAGGGMAAFYLPPSEDLSRPGRTFWPIGTMKWFPRWRFVTTAYHEGVPGHHLQTGGLLCLGDRLSRFQRAFAWVSGHGEGWALYAERLMAELGYLENPDYYLGMLKAQAFRAARVVIDIGLHLDLPIPAAESFHPGETWNYDLALEFGIERSGNPREFMASEIVRYLAQPAQAISYKVGERYWLEAREAAKQRMGPSFTLKEFHTRALALGPMGLDQLKTEIARSIEHPRAGERVPG